MSIYSLEASASVESQPRVFLASRGQRLEVRAQK